MPKFEIKYGLGGGFGGIEFNDWEEIEADDLEMAESHAYEAACQEYESYEGLHGIYSVQDYMDEDPDITEEDAEQMFLDDRESWVEYAAREVQE
jgi:hypothetical protein